MNLTRVLRIHFALLFPLFGGLLLSCQSNQKVHVATEKIILDTDMGSDCDDVGALALLHHYADLGKAEILGIIYSSGAIPYGAAVIDAINIYYGRGYIPVGADHETTFGDPVDKMEAEQLALDTGSYHHRIIHNRDALEQTALNRQLLTAAEDSSITYITIGHTRGLHALLTSGPDSISEFTGMELVRRKVKRWVALGALGAANPEGHLTRDWNFFFNNTAGYTAHLVDQFPGPIYFVDGGRRVLTGRSLADTPSGNILRTAYTQWLQNVEGKRLEDQRPSWDLVTVYFAVEGTGAYFEVLEPGSLEFDPEKGCRWNTSNPSPNHYFIRQLKETDQPFADTLNRMISAPPLHGRH